MTGSQGSDVDDEGKAAVGPSAEVAALDRKIELGRELAALRHTDPDAQAYREWWRWKMGGPLDAFGTRPDSWYGPSEAMKQAARAERDTKIAAIEAELRVQDFIIDRARAAARLNAANEPGHNAHRGAVKVPKRNPWRPPDYPPEVIRPEFEQWRDGLSTEPTADAAIGQIIAIGKKIRGKEMHRNTARRILELLRTKGS
jgi:hypothetical protein